MSAWGKVYSDLWRHEKWTVLSKGARALWTSALSWSKESKTYGRVPEHLLFIFGADASEAAELVDSGLWERDGKDFVFHDWAERQDTLAHDRDVSEKRSAAGRASGKTRRSQAKARTNANTTGTPVEQPRTQGGQNAPETAPSDDAPHPHETPSEALFPLVDGGSTNKNELERERERAREVTACAPSGARAFVYPDAFEVWWKAYPRKADKRAALASWRTATRTVPNDVLVMAAERYRDDPNRSEQYTKLPKTWLNSHAWENGPLPPRGGPGGGRPDALAQGLDTVARLRAARTQKIQTPQLEARRTA